MRILYDIEIILINGFLNKWTIIEFLFKISGGVQKILHELKYSSASKGRHTEYHDGGKIQYKYNSFTATNIRNNIAIPSFAKYFCVDAKVKCYVTPT